MKDGFWLALYQVLWLAVVAAAFIAACSWADRDLHGVPPEHASTQHP